MSSSRKRARGEEVKDNAISMMEAAFPARYEMEPRYFNQWIGSREDAGKIGVSGGHDLMNPRSLAVKVIKDLIKLHRESRLDVDGRVKWESFNLALLIYVDIQLPEGGVRSQFLTITLGNFKMEEFVNQETSVTLMEKAIIASIRRFGEASSGSSLKMFKLRTSQTRLTDLEWGRSGGCTTKKNTFEMNGKTLCQVRSKSNRCGINCLIKFFKDNKKALNKNILYNELIKFSYVKRKVLSILNPLTGFLWHEPQGWSYQMLNIPCEILGVNLVIYDLANLHGDPLNGEERDGEERDGELTCRLAWAAHNSILGDGDIGHYALIMPEKKVKKRKKQEKRVKKFPLEMKSTTCAKCSEVYDSSSSMTRHYCTFHCDQCGGDFKCKPECHACPVERERIISTAVDNDRMFYKPIELYETVTYRRKQVDIILAGIEDKDQGALMKWSNQVSEGYNTCVLGDAGTGKSFATARKLIELIESGELHSHEVAIVCAEAVGVRAYADTIEATFPAVFLGTIHSFIGLRVGRAVGELIQSLKRIKGDTFHRLVSCKILVIDEIGSCGTPLFNKLDKVLRSIRGSALPFGGVQMIYTGDFRQRGAFGGKEHSGKLFMEPAWRALDLRYTVLRHQHRMNLDDSRNHQFLRFQLLCARGILSGEDIDWINQECYEEKYEVDHEEVALTMRNDQVAIKGLQTLQSLFHPSEIRSFQDKGGGKKIRSALYDSDFKVAIGSPVMFTTNKGMKKAGKSCNGMIGIVTGFEEVRRKIAILVRTPSGIITRVLPVKLPSGKLCYHLRLAYARTIFKSQGATLKKARLFPPSDPSKSAAALMYVGISRTRSIDDFKISGVRLKRQCVRYDNLSLWFMDCIERMCFGEIKTMTELWCIVDEKDRTLKGGNTQALAPYCLQTISRSLQARDKSISVKEMELYTRDELEAGVAKDGGVINPIHYKGLFDSTIYYDFETADIGDGGHTPYFVVAHHWEKYNLKESFRYGVSEDDGQLQPNCNKTFGDWLLDQIVLPRCEEWEEEDHKTRSKVIKQIRMIAYNGSNFDVHFFMKYLLHTNENDRISFKLTQKASTIVVGDILYTSPQTGKTMSVISFWDPCLILNASLNAAHADWAKVKHRKMGKDCYPHCWLSEPGNLKRAFGYTTHEMDIQSAFPSSMWETVETRIKEGSLICGSTKDTVIFNCTTELLKYCEKDVIMLEDVVEAFAVSLWYEILPGHNVPPFKFNTAASIGFYTALVLMPDEFMVPQTTKMIRKHGKHYQSKIQRLTLTQDKFVRRSVFGGRTLPRALGFISSQYEELKAKSEAGTLSVEDYDKCKDCLYYIDAVGMYHSILLKEEFPYGGETELIDPEDISRFWSKFMMDPEDVTGAMFIAEFEEVIPFVSDVESALPSKAETGRLLWDNLPKKNIVYNSVHIRLGLRRGYKFSVPTKIILWGVKDKTTGTWSGVKDVLFSGSMRKWEKQRLEGGTKKQAAKLGANTTFGAMMKRDFTTELLTIVSDPDSPSQDMRIHIERLADDENWRLVSETTYDRGDGKCVLSAVWDKQINDDDFICSRASYIGSFVLAYAHCMIEKAVEDMLGVHRRDGSLTWQVHNGDTDSLFCHRKLLLKAKGKVVYHTTNLGDFNDDLKGLYGKPKTISYDEEGIPKFAKIIRGAMPGKKLYGIWVITPKGEFLAVDVKSKGIAKGKRNCIEVMKEDEEDEEVLPSVKRRKTKHIEELTGEHLWTTIADSTNNGIRAESISMKRRGGDLSREEVANGVEMYSIRNQKLSRHILRGGARFAPERVLVVPTSDGTSWKMDNTESVRPAFHPSIDNGTTIWGLPRGYERP